MHSLVLRPSVFDPSSFTYSPALSPCSSEAAAFAPSAASPAPAPCGGSPSSSGAPAAPAGASTPEGPAAAVEKKHQKPCQQKPSSYIQTL